MSPGASRESRSFRCALDGLVGIVLATVGSAVPAHAEGPSAMFNRTVHCTMPVAASQPAKKASSRSTVPARSGAVAGLPTAAGGQEGSVEA